MCSLLFLTNCIANYYRSLWKKWLRYSARERTSVFFIILSLFDGGTLVLHLMLITTSVFSVNPYIHLPTRSIKQLSLRQTISLGISNQQSFKFTCMFVCQLVIARTDKAINVGLPTRPVFLNCLLSQLVDPLLNNKPCFCYNCFIQYTSYMHR